MKYNKDHLNKIQEILSEKLYSLGLNFFEVKVLEKIENLNVDIIFDIISIKPKYVNKINIYGNFRTLDSVIRRELVFAEGDMFNKNLISQSNKNIQNLGIFQSIDIETKYIEENLYDIELFVNEKQTGEFQFGVSFTTINGAAVITGLKESNIGGTNRDVELLVNTSEDNTAYKFNITEPYIFNKKLNFSYGGEYSQKDYSKSSSYNLDHYKINGGFSYLITEDIVHHINLKYGLKKYDITNLSTVNSDLLPFSGANIQINLENSFIINKLNSFMRPSKGNYFRFDNVFSPILNDKDGFIRNMITYKKYNTLKSDYILSFQTRLANIYSLQNETLASDEKFALGGNWLRGFSSYGIGPRNSRTSYVGGNNLYALKIDLKKNIFTNSDNPLDLNLFTDFGSVFGNKNSPTNSSSSIRASYGLGFNFYSPIGPIGFSWGFPLKDESYDIKQMFLFTIGNVN